MTMEEKYGYEIDKGNLVSTWPEIDFVSLYLIQINHLPCRCDYRLL